MQFVLCDKIIYNTNDSDFAKATWSYCKCKKKKLLLLVLFVSNFNLIKKTLHDALVVCISLSCWDKLNRLMTDQLKFSQINNELEVDKCYFDLSELICL